MLSLSLQVPAGFVVVQGDLCFLDRKALINASSAEIEALNQSEDACAVEHLVLDLRIHLDIDADSFSVVAFVGDREHKVAEKTVSTFGKAMQCLEEVARDAWDLQVPCRDEDTTYTRPTTADALSQVETWIVPGGWSVIVDQLSQSRRTPTSSATVEPMEAVFTATSSHRAIAVYKLNRVEQSHRYVGLHWAEPPGRLYERLFFAQAADVASWLRMRLRHDALPRRRKRHRA